MTPPPSPITFPAGGSGGDQGRSSRLGLWIGFAVFIIAVAVAVPLIALIATSKAHSSSSNSVSVSISGSIGASSSGSSGGSIGASSSGSSGGDGSASANSPSLAGSAPAVPHTGTPAWSQPVTIDTKAKVQAVACAAPSFCLAVDSGGNVVAYNGSWLSPQDIGGLTDLISASCDSAELCAVLDNTGSFQIYENGGWDSPQGSSNAGAHNGLSCSPDLQCSTVTNVTSLVCPKTVNLCLATDQGDIVTSVGSVDNSTFQSKTIDPNGNLTDLSCASATFCVAVDDSGNAFSYDGTTWSAPDRIDTVGGLTSVSCPTTSYCAAVDDHGDVVTFNGSAWAAPHQVDPSAGGLVSVGCASARVCAAVDAEGKVVTYN